MQPPLVLAMLVCDDVYTDANTRKMSVMGLHGTIVVSKSSPIAERMTIFVCLTECPSSYSVKVRIIDVNEKYGPIGEMVERLDSPDPRAVMQGFYRFDKIIFDQEGEYRGQLVIYNELMLERRLAVLHR